jgi:isoquinoline 1-oxidoreductase subunit alpha
LPAAVFVAGDMGSGSGDARFEDQAEYGIASCLGRDRLDDSRVEYRERALVESAKVDVELGAELAGVVSGVDGEEAGPQRIGGLTDYFVVGGSMAGELTLSINGTKQVVAVAPETPLLFVLRNELNLTGPRMGCGMAQCGSCAVLLDGEEIRTCITPVSYAVGKELTSIEGLPALWAAEKGLHAVAEAKTLHPVQQAWIDEQVPQCGYCQSGMMIAAVQLLKKTPNPTVAQIKHAFTNTPPSPHLCRCGTYSAIIDAVQRAAKAMRA